MGTTNLGIQSIEQHECDEYKHEENDEQVHKNIKKSDQNLQPSRDKFHPIPKEIANGSSLLDSPNDFNMCNGFHENSEAKVEPKIESKVESKVEAKVESKVETKIESNFKSSNKEIEPTISKGNKLEITTEQIVNHITDESNIDNPKDSDDNRNVVNQIHNLIRQIKDEDNLIDKQNLENLKIKIDELASANKPTNGAFTGSFTQ